MADVSRAIAASSTAGIIVLALGVGGTTLVEPAWPAFDKQAIVRRTSQSSYSSVQYRDASNTSALELFAANVQNIFAGLSKSQTALGSEFEAAIYGGLEDLYEA